MKTKTIKQSLTLNADPHDVFEALMDSEKHSKIIDSTAVISREVGGSFTVYDGWAGGKNIELKQDKKIVQSWYAKMPGWPAGHLSTIAFALKKVKGGTKLDFTQSGIPPECAEELKGGWAEFYWGPLKRLFPQK
jgi:activator of HSP90 ATPase